MKLKNYIVVPLIGVSVCFAEQGPSVRIDGPTTNGNIVVFGEDQRAIVDSGIASTNLITTAKINVTNGVAGLDSNGVVNPSVIPTITIVFSSSPR